jgi:4-amino-4-deoxy-L-arabinose transferase-like glycosyltransferase
MPPRVLTLVLYSLVLVLAAAIRLINLQSPKALVFDEVYYVRDAWTMWNLGYEAEWVGAADFAAGSVNAFTRIGDFIAHPPLGKWLIGAGMALFGPENPFGWRIAAAVAGIIVVLLVMLIARRLFNSTATAALAGLLVAIDGIAITMSRTALLDGFLAMFILAAFLAILRHLDTPGWGGWLIVAGVLLGAATAVKWSGLYALAAFGVWVVIVETIRLRKARRGKPFVWRAALSAVKTFVLFVPVAVVVGYSRPAATVAAGLPARDSATASTELPGACGSTTVTSTTTTSVSTPSTTIRRTRSPGCCSFAPPLFTTRRRTPRVSSSTSPVSRTP